MKIPSKVNISGIIYNIAFIKQASDTLNKLNYFGDIDFVNCKIQICESTCKQMQEVTFIHEVLHGIAESCSVELGETEIDSLSHGIYAVLKNNNFKE